MQFLGGYTLTLKKIYYEKRNIDLGKSILKNQPSRKLLANRELITFKKLCKINSIIPPLGVGKFLDLGAGDRFLKLALENEEYIPLDIDDIDFESEKFPIKDGSIDILFSLAVIEHIKNIDHFMSECFRVLKPNGVIYLSTPNFRYSFRGFYDDPTHVRPFTEISLKETLKYYGFSNVETFPNARCKSEWFYKGKYKFTKCAYLPFLGSNMWAPKFLCGRAKGIFCLATKVAIK
jgi:SAM-dependent methyltransferase